MQITTCHASTTAVWADARPDVSTVRAGERINEHACTRTVSGRDARGTGRNDPYPGRQGRHAALHTEGDQPR
jgi:hypothetical protein